MYQDQFWLVARFPKNPHPALVLATFIIRHPRKYILVTALGGEVLTWLSIWKWGANDLHMVQLMPLPPHQLH